MIRAVLFDLDGTLKFNRPNGVEAFVQFSAELGLTFCADARRNVERWVHAYWSGKHSGVARNTPDPAAFWREYTRGMLNAAGIEDAACQYTQAIVQTFGERYHSETYVSAESHAVLRAVRERGYTLGLVSNRVEELTPVATELGLGDYFHFTLSGGQANSWKPDTRIFLQACEMADAAPDECLYVGDNFYADVIGSQAAGLTPVLLDPNDVFPDAACVRIACLNELLSVINQTGPSPLPLLDDGIIIGSTRKHGEMQKWTSTNLC
jgi:putative hydrolase of the HAD superfamily